MAICYYVFMGAKKGNQYAVGNKGGGRPPVYKTEYNKIAYNFALLGATEQQLADVFEVSLTTIRNWRKK